jgi:hypothetical protein
MPEMWKHPPLRRAMFFPIHGGRASGLHALEEGWSMVCWISLAGGHRSDIASDDQHRSQILIISESLLGDARSFLSQCHPLQRSMGMLQCKVRWN